MPRARSFAIIGAMFGRRESAKGKTTVPGTDAPFNNYGSAAHTFRSASGRAASGSGSGERLARVLEDVDDAELPSWLLEEDREAEGLDDEDAELEGDDDRWQRDAYRRAVRLYAIVPLCSLLLIVLFAFVPSLLWPASLPKAPSLGSLFSATLLASSLWCLSHALRIPLHKLISFLFSLSSSTDRVPHLSTFTHSILFASLQELLRLSSFAILSLQWEGVASHSGNSGNEHDWLVHDAVFREVWFIGLGWAIAEVCAGIVQGYEQLFLYDDYDLDDLVDGTIEEPFGENFRSDCVGLGDERLQAVTSCVGTDGLVTHDPRPEALGLDVERAVAHFARVKAREDLENIYGEPFVNIPVFVSLLQRVDSILLSLGLTLVMGFAYLLSSADRHEHILRRTFVVLLVIHAFLAVLHTPPVLSRISIHAAAYVACFIGLGLLFAGVGDWVGLW